MIPKTTIDKFAEDVTYAINHGESSLVTYSDGTVGQIMNFDIAQFIKSINGELLNDFSINDFKNKSIVYEFGSELQLYNQENFMLKENKLFMEMTYLGGIHNGPRYRLGTKITPGGGVNVTRICPLDHCKNIIGFFEFDMIFEG